MRIKQIAAIVACALFITFVGTRQPVRPDFSAADKVADGISGTFAEPLFAQGPPLAQQTGQTLTVTATTTSTGANTLLAAPNTGVRNYITRAQCVNTSASTQAVATIKSGSTVLWYVGCPPASVNQGFVTFEPAIRQPDTATALTMTMSTSVTTAYMNMSGFTGQ